jgi:hypothetical protein
MHRSAPAPDGGGWTELAAMIRKPSVRATRIVGQTLSTSTGNTSRVGTVTGIGLRGWLQSDDGVDSSTGGDGNG